jgi:cell wall-associated NlpC family hydrolase
MAIVNNIGLSHVLGRIRELEQIANPQRPQVAQGTQFSSVLQNVSGGSGEVRAMSAGSSPGSDAAIEGALSWGATQIGTKYAAVNPFRFGDVPWDGKAHESVNGTGTVFQYPAGTKVYDCSGFATTLYRKAGIDFADFNATTSASMLANIPRVDPSQARAGDLVILDSDGDGRSNHVGILDGNGMMLDAAPDGGVQRRVPNWDQMLGVVRPSLLVPQQQGAATASLTPAAYRFMGLQL